MTTTSCDPTTYEETDPDLLFAPVTIQCTSDLLIDMAKEWDERNQKTTEYFRRESFTEKFGLHAMPTTTGRLVELTKRKDHIPFDDVFLATDALSPTPVEEGGSLLHENKHSCLFVGEIEGRKILAQVLKKLKRSEEFFLHQIELRETCMGSRGVLELRGFSCDTKHLILIYEHLELGPLNTILADNLYKLPKLTWPARVQVIFELSCILHELHSKYQTAHLNVVSDNIFLDRHHRCKLGDFGCGGDSLEFNYIEDIHGLGKIMVELYFENTANKSQLDVLVEKLKKWGSDLTGFLSLRHALLCDVEEQSLLSYLKLTQFCLLCDYITEPIEVHQRVSDFYEAQTRLCTAEV